MHFDYATWYFLVEHCLDEVPNQIQLEKIQNETTAGNWRSTHLLIGKRPTGWVVEIVKLRREEDTATGHNGMQSRKGHEIQLFEDGDLAFCFKKLSFTLSQEFHEIFSSALARANQHRFQFYRARTPK